MVGTTEIEEISQIKRHFAVLVRQIFIDLLVYSFLAGRVAFNVDSNESDSDIDCVVVLKNRAYNDSRTKKKIKEFTDGYLKIHKKFQHCPDLDFPGDVISESQKEAALKGRGLVNKGRVEIFPILTDEDWDKEGVDYRVWLSELALNNDMFLTGDINIFRRDSLRAVDTILKFLLLDKKKVQIRDVYNEILEGGEPFLGFSSLYGKGFERHLYEKTEIAFSRLENSNYILKEEDYYLVNLPLMRKWRTEILKESEKPISYLISWQELRDYIKLVNSQKI